MNARREWYVYYRVAEPQWREAVAVVAAWQRELCQAHPPLTARLLRRPEARDGVTLMEVYAGADRADAALDADVERGAPALRRWLVGERHVERFDALD